MSRPIGPQSKVTHHPPPPRTREEKVNQLFSIFEGNNNNKISKNEIYRFLEQHNDNFDRTLDAILNYQPTSTTATASFQTPEEIQRQRNIDTVQNMFGGDDSLTRSVISTVYLQNQGDLGQTVDTLLNISHDEEAIEAIRTMNAQQKENLEREMKKEQERRLNERKERLDKAIEDDRRTLRDLEEEKLMREKANEEAIQLAKEREHQQQSLENKNKNNNNDSDNRDKSLEEHDKQIQQKKNDIAHKQFLMSKIIQEAALCTLSVRYCQKSVVVSWSLGNDMKPLPGDWIGFYKIGKPLQNYRNSIKTSGAIQGHSQVPTPKTPGLYNFKYFVDGSYNEVATSDVIHIGPQLTLKAQLVEDETNPKNNLITVTYTLNGGELSADDWFGLYSASENNNKAYIAYQKIGKYTADQSFQIPAPRTPGDYVVRFFPHLCGYTFVGKSNTVRVTNKDKLNLVLTKDESKGRITSVQVSWDIFSVDISSYDYIALYKKNSLNYYYEQYKYVDVSTKTVVFEAPHSIGSYDVRYHSSSQSRYVDVVRSDPIQIENSDSISASYSQGTVTVTWDIHSQPHTSWDWIGIFKKGATNKNFLDYKYVVDASTKVVVFNLSGGGVKQQEGIYEARYFSSLLGKYSDFRICSFVIEKV